VKVKKVMNSRVNSCGVDTDLVTAAQTMSEKDCGALPVLDQGKVVGMITDRDICLALASRGESASSTRVDQVMSTEVYHCRPKDDLKSALKTMRQKRVRRLPVTGRDGELEGILSFSDVALNAERSDGKSRRGLSNRAVLSAFRGICNNERPNQQPEENEAAMAAH
jgi:CBS domain-containing protein